MAERKLDRSLNIKTVGIREWGYREQQYNRYEATPYTALERLFQVYKLDRDDRVVDFGCGRGRVTFYIHHRFRIPVTGIEAHDKTFEEALINKKSYKRTTKHIDAPIRFEYALAEQYPVDHQDNCFYFFNPFSIKIFRKVVMNILHSYEEEKRTMDLILYYPLPEFKEFLQKETPFQLINKVKASREHGKYGKFLIYRTK